MREQLKRTITLLLLISVVIVSAAVPVQAVDLDELPAENVWSVSVYAGSNVVESAYSETGYYIATYDPKADIDEDSEILSADASADVPYTDDETEIYNRMIAMQDEYPEGRHWTNADSYIWYNIYHASGSDILYNSYTGYGCVAFAMILSDAAFGNVPAYEVKNVVYDKLKTGDILRINNDLHTVIILEKREDGVVVAEGNYNSSIHWGRFLDRSVVEAANYYVTRYTESFDCRFESNGGTEIPSVKVVKGKRISEPDQPVKNRYLFAGWFKDPELTKPWNFNSDTVKQDITLYAKWKVDESLLLKNISLDKTNIMLPLDTTEKLNVTVTPAESHPDIKWSTDDECIKIQASEDGRSVTVTPVSKGTANITVTAVEKFDSIEITKSITTKVIVKRPAGAVKATMIAGEQVDVSKAFFDDECPAVDFEYSVAPAGLAAVSKKGILNVNKAGNVIVTVKDKYNKEEYGTVSVNILPKPVFNVSKPLSYIGQEVSIYDMINNLPKDSGYKFMDFSSSKPDVATISPEGIITAKSSGKTQISVVISQKGTNGAVKNYIVKAFLTVKIPKYAKTSYSVMTGQKLTIAMSNVDTASGVTFVSDDPESLTAQTQMNNKGLATGKVIVTGLKATPDNDPVHIIATVDGREYPCDIYVMAPVISKGAAVVKVGKTTTVSLKNTRFKKNDVVWESEDESSAAIEPGGKVRGIKAGEVTVFTLTGGVRNECRITVTQ